MTERAASRKERVHRVNDRSSRVLRERAVAHCGPCAGRARCKFSSGARARFTVGRVFDLAAHVCLSTMGRKCFVPRCNTGYKSCEQKFSLFSAPKDEARLKLWRHAIPRKDRILKASDHVCERHFEPRFVSKTWTAEYNGNVLVSTPRRACLSDDAVPSIFPDCPAHLSKLVKHRKRPAVRQPACVPRQKRFHPADSTEKAEEADDPKVSDLDHAGPSSTESTDAAPFEVGAPEVIPSAEGSRQQVFNNLFEQSASVVLPSISWGYHRRDTDGIRNVAFTEMKWSTSPKVRELSTDAATSTESSHLVTTKVVDIDQNMQVSVSVMGRRVSVDAFHIRDDVATTEDVKTFLQSLHEIPICGGGPKTSVYPLAHPESASVDACNRWRHKKCPLLVRGNSTCKWCSSLSDTLRIRQKREMDKRNGTKPTKRYRFSSVPSSDRMLAFRRARNALKRSKERLLKRVKVLREEMKQAQAKMQSMSMEVLNEKLGALKLPAPQVELIKECVSAAKCRSKNNRRYTEHWILICLLLHIRSPSGYSFLRDNEILPLPCVTTVRKYLSMLRVKCGFDTRFFFGLQEEDSHKVMLGASWHIGFR